MSSMSIVGFFSLVALGQLAFGQQYDHSDSKRSVPEILKNRGFIPEIHTFTTKDGYILEVHRIRHPDHVQRGQPVILHHGLVGSSADFIINSLGEGVGTFNNQTVGNNLGMELSHRGYDVWLANSRGNIYSKKHKWLPTDKRSKYWDFTFGEKIQYDLPALIDYVLAETGAPTVGYVGHSQGTLIMFGLLSTQKKYNDLIKPFIALAPVATVSYIRSPLKIIANSRIITALFRYRSGPLVVSNSILKLISKGCSNRLVNVCQNLVFLLTGFNEEQLDQSRVPVYMSHSPAGTTSWNLLHYGQGYTTKKFSAFDMGSAQANMAKYNRPTPPEFMPERITNKYIALFSSLNDWLATPEDVDGLKSRMRVKLLEDYVVPENKWNHMDFIWGKDQGRLINSKVVKLLKEYA